MNLEKTNGSLSAGIPIPVSFTAMRKTAWPSIVSTSETRNSTDPASVNLMAFPRRLRTTCRTRPASPKTRRHAVSASNV